VSAIHPATAGGPATTADGNKAQTTDSPARLIEWTGERMVPWSPDYQTVYEHLHRYHFAAQVCEGKRVLDLASGEGYGSAILGKVASEVIGIDIDHASVEHARLHHGSDNVHFLEGSMLDSSALGGEQFDVVVCFEALEHVDDHATLLDVVCGALHEGGIFFVSTPDRTVYSRDYHNPFHVHELDPGEFRALLSPRFARVVLYGQMVATGSLMQAIDPIGRRTGELIAVAGEAHQWPRCGEIEFPYLIAVASSNRLKELPAVSTLVDTDLLLARGPTAEAERVARESERLAHSQELHIDRQREHIEHLEDAVRNIGKELAARDHDLQAITSSRGWRAVLTVRRVVHTARGLGSSHPRS
jgi:SAM-dependent methyltransferase